MGRSLLSLVSVLAGVLLLPAAASAAPGVSPASYSATLAPGTRTTVTKTVHTPPIPANPDIMILSDTTGSMGTAIANVQQNANAIMTAIAASEPTAEFGAASYKDVPGSCIPADPYAFRIDQAITTNRTNVQTGIDSWSAGGGCDDPEAQINALYQLATDPAVGFRTNSTRIIVWFGDAPGHDPSNGHTLADAIHALTAANIHVIAVPVSTPSSGLDAQGQATQVASATGGEVLPSATPDQVANAILSGLTTLPVTVTPSPSCDSGLTATYDAPRKTVTSGSDVTFSETLSVASSATGTLHCTVDFLLNGTSARGFQESNTITTPPSTTAIATSLSGGGQSGTSITVPAGTAVTVSATLSGTNASTATGTVTYNVYSDPSCTTLVNRGQAETITSPGRMPASAPLTLNVPATYYWQAVYSGDSANRGSVSPCTVGHNGSVTVTATKKPDVGVACKPGVVVPGGSTTCTATVNGRPPAGSVSFTSTGGPAVSGGGSCIRLTASDPCSVTFTLDRGASGTFTLTAFYSGDTVYAPGSGSTNVATPAPAGVAAAVSVVRGKVLILVKRHRRPHATADDTAGHYVPLIGTVSLPEGSTIDARKGVLTVSTAANYRPTGSPSHRTQSATFAAAIFEIQQLTAEQAATRAERHGRRKPPPPSTDLMLHTPPGRPAQVGCRGHGRPGKGVVNKFSALHSNGFYRAFGRSSITTIKGNATWAVLDRCDGTVTEMGVGSATVTPTGHARGHQHARVVHSGQALLIQGRFL